MSSQPSLTDEEKRSFDKYHEFLSRELPQFYFGVVIIIMQSIAHGNMKTLQDEMAKLSQDMDALNSGEGLA